MEIKLFSTTNENSITVPFEENTNNHPTTLRDILSERSVIDSFDDDPADCIACYKAADSDEYEDVTESLAKKLLRSPVTDGEEYGIESDCLVEPQEEEQAGNGATAGQYQVGSDGLCTVLTNGGFGETKVPIKHGVTKLSEVIYNPEVVRKNGSTATSMNNWDITQNNVERRADSFDYAPVYIGDVIRITLRTSKDGGRR